MGLWASLGSGLPLTEGFPRTLCEVLVARPVLERAVVCGHRKLS